MKWLHKPQTDQPLCIFFRLTFASLIKIITRHLILQSGLVLHTLSIHGFLQNSTKLSISNAAEWLHEQLWKNLLSLYAVIHSSPVSAYSLVQKLVACRICNQCNIKQACNQPLSQEWGNFLNAQMWQQSLSAKYQQTTFKQTLAPCFPAPFDARSTRTEHHVFSPEQGSRTTSLQIHLKSKQQHLFVLNKEANWLFYTSS